MERQLRKTKLPPDVQRNQHCEDAGRYCKVQYIYSGFWRGYGHRQAATLTFRIDPGLKEALRIATDQEHRSIANMVEVLIPGHCERHNWESKTPEEQAAAKKRFAEKHPQAAKRMEAKHSGAAAAASAPAK